MRLPMRRLPLLLSLLLIPTACSDSSDESFIFELVVQNTAPEPSFTTASGRPAIVAFAPALAAVHSGQNPIYTIGQLAPANGLEAFAEDGDSSTLITTLQTLEAVSLVLIGAQPIEEDAQQGILLPGQSFRIVFNAENKSAVLSLAIPYLQSNDVFVGSGNEGIPLFNEDGTPFSGEISSRLNLLDAGTEVNQAPGEGADQALLQDMPNQGASEGGPVRPVDDGFEYPAVGSMLSVRVNPLSTID